jgi:uncharacterized protein (TIGR00251 family)
MLIQVKVVPKSSKRMVSELSPDNFKVWVHSAPEKGKANEEVIELISKYFAIPSSRIKVLKGEHSRTKTLAIDMDSLSRKIGSQNKEA